MKVLWNKIKVICCQIVEQIWLSCDDDDGDYDEKDDDDNADDDNDDDCIAGSWLGALPLKHVQI